MTTLWHDKVNDRYIDEATGLVVPNPSGQLIYDSRPELHTAGNSYIPGTDANTDPAWLQQTYGVAPTRDAAGLYHAPNDVLHKASDPSGGIQGFLDGPGAVLLPLIIASMGAASSLGGFGGAAGGGGAYSGGATGAFDMAGLSGTGIPEAWGITGGGASGAGTGAGMDFLNSGFNALDPSTWYGAGSDALQFNPSILDPGYTQGGFLDSTLGSGYMGSPYQPGFNLFDPSTYGGSGGSSLFDSLSNMPSSPLKSLLQQALGGAAGGAGGGAGGNQGLLSSLLGTAAGTIPSALIGNWAMNQRPDINPLYQTYNDARANGPSFIQAAQTPLRESQAMGYGDLLQSQASRGIRGSSFGDRDIGQYLNTTNRGIAGAGINAAQGALGIQGQLAQGIPRAQNESLAAIAPILGNSVAGIGQGLRGADAQNLGTNISNLMSSWFPSLFSGG